jgi:hypothetical protein
MVGRKPMRRRRSERAPPPPPQPSSSFGATARPTSPRYSAAAVAADLDELLLTSEPRSFPYAVKQQCWENAEQVPGEMAARRAREHRLPQARRVPRLPLPRLRPHRPLFQGNSREGIPLLLDSTVGLL